MSNKEKKKKRNEIEKIKSDDSFHLNVGFSICKKGYLRVNKKQALIIAKELLSWVIGLDRK